MVRFWSAAIVSAALALSACDKPASDPTDNAFNKVQADAKARLNAENTPEYKAAANIALAPLSNSAPANTAP